MKQLKFETNKIMAKDIIKIIDLKNFPITRTIFYLLQEQDQRKERTKAEIKS